jgi:DUF4097 and DUF4098 domain-containing protein YvlB
MRSVTVNYTIGVPPETEVQTDIGSGSLEVRGIHGPANLSTRSGAITAENIRENAQATTGSGNIALAQVGGHVLVRAASGRISLREIRGDIRATTGSGKITIDQPGGRIAAKTGSGAVTVNGATADLRASSGSGRLTIEGNPAPGSYWELRTGSGSVEINVPASARFRIHARCGSGRFETSLPLVIEEQSRREIRARMGTGEAHVEALSGSGGIEIH